MKKHLILLLTLTFINVSNAQVGIGTMTPRGALDINNPTTNIHGLVLPTNESINNIVNPQTGEERGRHSYL
ncbi:hypothetical protein K5I29_11485 [Flavobacterium agricola]|uniref:Uncharacterized protein n=1 Tax=Flavobacterium agricola TaxID=2870839 RepID=A0ABY6M090_9FLAO|nr:hypothetical protein [Flavobacterium agricola]UYW01089.1 hypothetical protein K5I29_11485 [Flavobacterium agricola]